MIHALRVWTTLTIDGREIAQDHPDLPAARQYVDNVIDRTSGPLAISIHRLRYFREETSPTKELYSIYRR